MILRWFVLSLSLSFAKAKNVAMTSSGIAVAANGGDGLILQQTASGPAIQPPLPTGIQSFDDVSIDAENEALVFALSTTSRRVCSFTISAGDLTLVNCVGEGDNFGVSPFCGVSAFDSTLIISGGTVGLTIYQYDTGSGVISNSPSVLNYRGLGAIGHPDVVLVNVGLAALSTDFSGTPRFGTLMASIQGSNVNNEQEFRVQDSLGFNLLIQPANFPLVNAIYEARYIYTANGPMQVQDLQADSTGDILSGAPTGFSAVTVAVNTAKKIAVFGGVSTSGGSRILFYDLSVDPRNPSLVGSVRISEQRITSIASGGNVAAYTTVSLDTIQYEQLPPPTVTDSMPPTAKDLMPPTATDSMPPAATPTATQMMSPTESPNTSSVGSSDYTAITITVVIASLAVLCAGG